MKTRIGVRGLPEGPWPEAIDDFEIDALDPGLSSATGRRKILCRLLPHQRLTLTLGHYFLRGDDSVDRRERIRVAVERFEFLGARSATLIVPPSFAKGVALPEASEILIDEFKRAGFKPPRIDAPFKTEGSLERIGDPLWRKTRAELLTKEWRIHGYHPVRWIRLYSEKSLAELANKMSRHKPERITFAHSQRFVQASEFASRFSSR